MSRVLVGILQVIVGFSATASEQRPLTDSEEADLKAFASEKVGVDTWYVQSYVTELKNRNEAHAMVVYEPASAAEYCLAPAVTFVGKSTAEEPLIWSTRKNEVVSYRFWFGSCDSANADSAITLKVLLDFDVLERINEKQESIVGAIEKRFEVGLEETDPPSSLQLSEIDLRYDAEHGPVYHIKYSVRHCSWLSADVIFDSNEANVIRAWRVVC